MDLTSQTGADFKVIIELNTIKLLEENSRNSELKNG